MLTATIACVPKPKPGQVLACPGEILAFLHGIKANNVLLVDNEREMVSRLCEAIRLSLDHIPPAYEKRLAVMIESLRNLPTIVPLPFVAMSKKDDTGVDGALLAHRAAGDTGADAFMVVPPLDVEAIRPALPQVGAEVVDLRIYGSSGLEQRRNAFCEQIAAADRNETEVTDLFRRALRYSRSLALYDRNLGKYFEVQTSTDREAGKLVEGRKRFAASLEFFLSQWRETRHSSSGELTANVLTAFDSERIAGLTRAEQGRFHSVVRDFAKDVAVKTGVRVHIEIKAAPWRVAHDRYIETDQAILALPGGIDIIHQESPDPASTPNYRSNRNVQLVLGDDVRVDLERYSDTRTFLQFTVG